jgi:hypothetical protein
MHGDLALTQRKKEDEPKVVKIVNSDGEEEEVVQRVDPITRFKEGIA